MASTTSENSINSTLNTLLIFDFDKTVKDYVKSNTDKISTVLEYALKEGIHVVMVSEDNGSVRSILQNTFGYNQAQVNEIDVTSPVVHSGKTNTFLNIL